VVVFWIWLGCGVLLVPPIAIGLALAAIYLYIHVKYGGDLRWLVNVATRRNSEFRLNRKSRWKYRSYFQRIIWGMVAEMGDHPPHKQYSFNHRLFVVWGLFIVLSCTAIGLSVGFDRLGWILLLVVFGIILAVVQLLLMMKFMNHLLRICQEKPS
jgi:hypothetical protein